MIALRNGETVCLPPGLISLEELEAQKEKLPAATRKPGDALSTYRVDIAERNFVRLAVEVNKMADENEEERELMLVALNALRHMLEKQS